jgi:glycosyltransferase involved in cell wall biosynthesis
MNRVVFAEPSVSVVIPCFQSVACIGRALESVFAQTRLPLEVILVDDGNPPAFNAEVARVAALIPEVPVRVLTNLKNSGPSFSRNRGWDAARGDLIAFLDHDDAWHPGKLAWQAGCFRDDPDVALVAHRSVCVEAGALPARHLNLNPAPGPACGPGGLVGGSVSVFPITWSALSRSNFFSTPTVMVKRSLTRRFNPDYRYGEDYDLWMRIILAGHRGLFGDAAFTYLFKDRFGAGGLSGDLWRMEKGIQRVFRRLARDRVAGEMEIACLRFYAALKFLRRLAIRKFMPDLSR